MTRTIARLAVVLLASLAALASSPSVNSAAKADVDRRIAAFQPQARELPAPTVAEPMPLAVGQWAQYKQTDQDGKPSIVTYKIVGEQDGAFWYEIAMDTYYGHSAQKMLVNFGDRRDPGTFQILAVLSKDYDGKVTEMPKETLSMMRGTYEQVLQNVAISWTAYPQEDVQVLAGRFAGAYRGRSTVSIMGFSSTSDVWYHPAVPVIASVKTVGVDRPMTMELVDFGTTGAQSEF